MVLQIRTSACGLFYSSRTPGSAPRGEAVRLDTQRTKHEHGRMPFENERDDIVFTIRMGLMHCRTSPKSERNERVQRIQAEAVFTHLERCGYRLALGRWSSAGLRMQGLKPLCEPHLSRHRHHQLPRKRRRSGAGAGDGQPQFYPHHPAL